MPQETYTNRSPELDSVISKHEAPKVRLPHRLPSRPDGGKEEVYHGKGGKSSGIALLQQMSSSHNSHNNNNNHNNGEGSEDGEDNEDSGIDGVLTRQTVKIASMNNTKKYAKLNKTEEAHKMSITM